MNPDPLKLMQLIADEMTIRWTIPQVVEWLESVGARKLKNVRKEKPTYSYYD